MMAKPEGKRPHWRPRRRWKVDDDDDEDEDDNDDRMDFQEIC